MTTLAKHIDNYSKYCSQAMAHCLDYYKDKSDINWRYYDRAYDRMKASAQVLEDLGIEVTGHLEYKDPHTL